MNNRVNTAICQVASTANKSIDEWVNNAAIHLGYSAKVFGVTVGHTIEQLRLSSGGFEDPPDLRAWGAATRLAVKNGYIKKTGDFSTCVYGSPKPLYVYSSGISTTVTELSKNSYVTSSLEEFMI